MNSWKSIPVKLITRSFRLYALTLSNEGQEDNQILCFKPGRPSEAGREFLNQQVKFLTDESLHIKPSHLLTTSDYVQYINVGEINSVVASMKNY